MATENDNKIASTSSKHDLSMGDYIKAFLISAIPLTIIREILKGIGLYSPIIIGVLLVSLVLLATSLRQRIKSSGKELWPFLFMMLLCFPAGLYYFWKYSKWTRRASKDLENYLNGL